MDDIVKKYQMGDIICKCNTLLEQIVSYNINKLFVFFSGTPDSVKSNKKRKGGSSSRE